MSRGPLKYTCGRSLDRKADGRFRLAAADSRCGPATALTYTAKGDSFAAGKPRLWTETRLRGIGNSSNYDLAPDGNRLAAFVAADASVEKPPTHLTFPLNFFDELRRKAPGS